MSSNQTERTYLVYEEHERSTDFAGWIARLGAACYVAWGLLHYTGAYAVYELGSKIPTSMERGRLHQDAFYIAALATVGIVTAVLLNWRNDRIGFWLNTFTISIGDIPFVLFVLVPGYLAFWPGVLGPALWVAGLILTALGQVLNSTVVAGSRPLSHRPSTAM
jgi:hypothetical protein